MRVTTKGQVTIPQPIRRAAGIGPGTEVEFALSDGGVIELRRAGTDHVGRGAEAVAALQGTATSTMSTDELMRLLRE